MLCPNLPPVCPGGQLLGWHSTPEQIYDYIHTNHIQLPTNPPCRFMAPPRCYINQKKVCIQQCS
jgi:hypothetical protein